MSSGIGESGRTHHPWIFNLGATLTGVAGLVGAFGRFRALRTVTWTALAGLVALSVVAKGVLSLKAGMFTMPDPQHASWQFLIPAILRSLQAERVVREAHGGVIRS